MLHCICKVVLSLLNNVSYHLKVVLNMVSTGSDEMRFRLAYPQAEILYHASPCITTTQIFSNIL